MSRRSTWVTVRLTTDERQRLAEVARKYGYIGITQFALASLRRSVTQAEAVVELRNAKKRQAATWAAVRTEIARLQRTDYVVFAMLENLAKTILTYIQPPPAESKAAAIAHGKAGYERYLKAVAMSLHNGSKFAADQLAGLD
jgi:hypothetical protein